jgi:hypothetical protein
MQELNFTSTIWRPPFKELFSIFLQQWNFFYKFYCYIINENIQTSNVFFNSKYKGVC